MRKPEKLGQKLLVLAVVTALLALWQYFQLPCTIRALTGFPCPGCGMTRAWLAALGLDFAAAFRYHPMFWCIPVLVVFIIYDGRIFPGKKVNILIWGSLFAGVFLVYLARFMGFLGGFP